MTSAERRCHVCAFPFASRDVLWTKDGFEIAKCRRCGLVQRAEMPTAAELDEIYARDYFVRADDDTSGQGYLDYVSDAAEHRLNAQRRLEMLARHGATGGRLLDVGAAAGFFVDEARKRGWEVEGLDVSPDMTEYARTELALPVTTGHFKDFTSDRTFDLITMWDYIEHTVDPVGDVERAASLLRPGGLLVLSTGDIDTFVARASGRRWHLLTPRHHNYFFSARTLDVVLSGAGLEVESSKHRAGYFSVTYLVHKLRTMLPAGRAIQWVADRISGGRLGAVSVPVSLGDIVTVVARKP